MPSAAQLRLMTKVARLYHEQFLRQSDIAEQLDLSQAKVSRLLKEAQREGIVRTTVSVPLGVHSDIEDSLQTKYGLKEVIVADCERETEEEILRSIGSAAAHYLETTLRDGEVLGVSSWSATILATVDALHPVRNLQGTRIVQILGGVGNPAAEVHASHLIRRLAELIRAEATFLPATGVARSMAARKAYLKDQFVREAVEMFDGVTLALVGVGALQPSQLLASSGNIFSSEELDALKSRGAVGDICLRFFNASGKPVSSPLDKRVIGMSLEKLRRVKRSVGLAGGKRKLAAIRGALQGGLVNVLITDRFTAERLVRV
jgi:DNA-binding transcriptional regulator LsrR (DeoR family)